jgi:uncharacterized protein
MKNLLEFLLNHIVDNPQDLEIIEEEDYRGKVYQIKVNPEDVGKVIGRRGSKIKAIRKICQVLAIKRGEDCKIVIAE